IAAVLASLLEGGLAQRVPMHCLNTHADTGAAAKAGRFVSAWLSLLAALVAGRVALVHAHVASDSSFWRKSLLLALARGFGVPTVFHLHGGGFADFTAKLGPGLRQRWVRHSLQASDRVVCLSARWQTWVQGFAPAARVAVVQNPVRVPSDAELAALRGARDQAAAPYFLYLGLIAPAKGSFDLLRAWPAVLAQAPAWQLKVGGNGQTAALLQTAADLGVAASVQCLGWVAGEPKQQLIAAASAFVLPSYNEGSPVAVLEAMAHGVPVVCTPVGGVPDIVADGQEGLLVPVGDSAALADALLRLTSQPALREALGQAGRRRVLAHNALPVVVDQWLALYRGLRP
ncbi:MAG: hypothetical protein CFE45_31680, partial [Burkholderiales bacterium PBB5]